MVRVFFVLVFVAVACELARADNRGCEQNVETIDQVFEQIYSSDPQADNYDTHERCEMLEPHDVLFDECNMVLTDCGL